MTEFAFEVDHVVYRYRRAPALNGLSLRVPFGRRVALLGANGSGKSTLLRLLGGLYFAESGTLRYRGRTVTEQDFLHDDFAHAFRRSVGLVFQDPDVQLFCPSVFDEVAFGPLQLGIGRQEILDAVDRTLQEFDIAHLRDRSPHRLSGGEKKRVALASVVVMDPTVLLLDEPTAALDPRSQARMLDLLERWHAPGRSIVVATHELRLLPRIADECVVLGGGQVLGQGTPEEILRDRHLLEQANLLDPGLD